MAKWKSEKAIKDHYVKVSDDMENDFTIPVVDYSLRIEDREGQVIFQSFSHDATGNRESGDRGSYTGIPVSDCNDHQTPGIDCSLRRGSATTLFYICKHSCRCFLKANDRTLGTRDTNATTRVIIFNIRLVMPYASCMMKMGQRG